MELKKIKIGDQVWTAENLRVDKFRNGDAIMNAVSADEWKQAIAEEVPAFSDITIELGQTSVLCKLYNWYAVIDSRNLAPEGWHIPSDHEWGQLINCLGGENKVDDKLKSVRGWIDFEDTSEFDRINLYNFNQSGFSAFPCGNRSASGLFSGAGRFAHFWSSTMQSERRVWTRNLHMNPGVDRYSEMINVGISVRCIQG